MATRTINVIIADDHDLVRTGIKRMLADIEGIKVIGEASSGEQVIQLARELEPDVVMMDVKMPGIGGLEATKKLLQKKPDLKILVVTVLEDDLFPVKLLEAGAAGYLTKGSSLDEMVQAIRTVFMGQRYISPEVATHLAFKNLNNGKKSPFDNLSERELQVTLMVINGQTVQVISEKLFLSPKTINSYRYRIFEKLKVKNDVELTLLAIRHGILDAHSSGEA